MGGSWWPTPCPHDSILGTPEGEPGPAFESECPSKQNVEGAHTAPVSTAESPTPTAPRLSPSCLCTSPPRTHSPSRS